MINEFVLLASSSWFNQGELGQMLSYWEQAGFFSYLLPFLLIFALVFGILTQIKLFKDNKAINGIIAFVVGLMALQFDMVPQFFAVIFPRLGVGLAIFLVLLILAGLFIDPNKGAIVYTLLGIGAVIAIVVLVSSAGELGWSSGYWWSENWPMVAGVAFILTVIGIIVGGSSTSKPVHSLALFDPTK